MVLTLSAKSPWVDLEAILFPGRRIFDTPPQMVNDLKISSGGFESGGF